ncbi:MAG: hypothetical protein AABZ02_11515 [Bacteroidota bacterium]
MRMLIGCVVVALLMCTSVVTAQFKSKVESKPSVTESIIRPDDGGLLFGWFDPSKLTMHHSFSLSYQSFGGQGLSLGVYTNSLMYKFSDALDLQADVSLMHSPFSSFGKQFQQNLSGLYLSRAELNYRPWKNTLLHIQYRQLPPMYWLGSGYRSYNFFNGIDRYEEDKR